MTGSRSRRPVIGSRPLISVSEIAVRLGMSKARVWAMLRCGVIPAWRPRPGAHWVIKRAEFQAWLELQGGGKTHNARRNNKLEHRQTFP